MDYFELQASDDAHEQGSWELLASVREADLPAARAEAQALLARAEAEAPGLRGAMEDGGLWDADLHEQRETDGWTTITLTLTGPWAWGEALLG